MADYNGFWRDGRLGTPNNLNACLTQEYADATDLPADALEGVTAVIRHTGDVYRYDGTQWIRIYYAPRYEGESYTDQVGDFNLQGATANTPIYKPLSSFGPFKAVGSIKVTNATAGTYFVHASRQALVKVIYKVTDSPTPNDDVTLTAADNGYTAIDAPVTVSGNPPFYTLGAFSVNPDVLVGQYIHIGLYAFNDTGAMIRLGTRRDGFYISGFFVLTAADKLNSIAAGQGAGLTTGAQTITGKKTFTSKPVLPATEPQNNEAVSRSRVDTLISEAIANIVSSGGLTLDEVNARIAAWAQVGNDEQIPLNKLGNAPGGGTDTTGITQSQATSLIARLGRDRAILSI